MSSKSRHIRKDRTSLPWNAEGKWKAVEKSRIRKEEKLNLDIEYNHQVIVESDFLRILIYR